MKTKGCALLLVLLVSIPGCGRKKEKAVEPSSSESVSEVTIPVAGDSVKSFFNEDVEEFVLMDDATTVDAKANQVAAGDSIAIDQQDKDFAWMEEVAASEHNFETVYFDFDKHEIASDQEQAVAHDIEEIKQVLAAGDNPTIVIEGHACHSAGSHTYNLALSEKRARKVADKLIAAGISEQQVKVVPRGDLVPELKEDGSQITGDAKQQWRNRRAKVNIVYS